MKNKETPESLKNYENWLISLKPGRYSEQIKIESRWLRRREKQHRRRAEHEGASPHSEYKIYDGVKS